MHSNPPALLVIQCSCNIIGTRFGNPSRVHSSKNYYLFNLKYYLGMLKSSVRKDLFKPLILHGCNLDGYCCVDYVQ